MKTQENKSKFEKTCERLIEWVFTHPVAAMLTALMLLALAYMTVWVVSSALEANTFNRLTGAHVSTWDAMWVELRVQQKDK